MDFGYSAPSRPAGQQGAGQQGAGQQGPPSSFSFARSLIIIHRWIVKVKNLF